ncbi:MAG: CHAD domain-containing protein [Nocardioides sp.]
MGEAAGVLGDRLRALAGQVRAADRAVRDAEPEGVHDLRVAMRRTRSLLRTFGPLLEHRDAAEAGRLGEELRWAGVELGAARDLEVVLARLVPAEVLSGAWPGGTVEPLPAPMTDWLEQHWARAGAGARRQMDDLLGSARYAVMLVDLDTMAGHVSWQSVTKSDVRGLLRREWRRVRRRAAAAEHSPPGEDRGPAMHDVRKAAKRTRYAAESLTPLLGDRAARMADVAERIQESLGTHRDTLLSRGVLDRLAGELAEGPEVAAAVGRLHMREATSGERALEDYARARDELDDERHRRWLR